ncbi:GNAT family protein [Nesterenkonia flava]|uniref:GNAT family N-acetyltransferase n=1 Tax=Nesterenkonia flava TaxID=469799 RepID=UPI0031D21569
MFTTSRGSTTSERVRLRALTEADVPVIAQWWNTPDIALFNDRMLVQKPQSVIEEMIRGWSENRSGGGFGYAVEAEGQLAGHASVYGYNARGIRAYEKAGFVVEGRRRASVLHQGRWFDDVSMGILAEEYLTRHRNPKAP